MKKHSIIVIIMLFSIFPITASAWPLAGQSGDYLNYYEECDAVCGTVAANSDEYILRSALGRVFNQGAASVGYSLHQGMYFNVFRDLLPPGPVTIMTATSRLDGNVDLAWNSVTDEENEVLGYRVYCTYYYGPQPFPTRLVDARDNTGNAYLDTTDLLAGIQYYYEVRAIDAALNEPQAGNKRELIEVVSQPYSITDLSAFSKPGGDIYLEWSAISGRDYYNVYRSVTYGVKGGMISVGGGITEPNYLDAKTNLEGGNRYFYVVQAVVTGQEETKGNNQASAVSDQGGPNAPVISSDTHPVQGQPYPNPNPSFQWIPSADPGLSLAVKGYYVKLSNSGTLGTPVTGEGWEFITGIYKAYQTMANGNWYFHCRAEDQAGNLGDEAVYQIQIMATGIIQGTVIDPAVGTGLSGVVGEAWLGGKKQGYAHTAADGTYQISGVPFGSYTIRFNRFGYRPLERKAVVLDMGSTPLTVNVDFVSEPMLEENRAVAYPNPAGGSEIRIIYYCEENSEVIIEIYNVSGEMAGKIRENKPAGYQYSSWPLGPVARGIYIFRIRLRGESGKSRILKTGKFSVVK